MASSAVEAFRIAFDRAYAVPDPRGMIENRLLAILLVFIGAFVAALLGVSIVFSPLILRFLEQVLLLRVPLIASYLTYMFGVLVFIGFLLLMHRLLPGRRVKRVWPGVLVTTVVWVALASGFSFYLTMTPGLHRDLRHPRRRHHHADVLLSDRRDDYLRGGGQRRAEPDRLRSAAAEAVTGGKPWPSA